MQHVDQISVIGKELTLLSEYYLDKFIRITRLPFDHDRINVHKFK